MNIVELSRRIRRLRTRRNLTLEQVARRSSLSKSALSKVENFRATPSLPALGRIAEALETTVAELVAGLDNKPLMVIVDKDERLEIKRDRPASRIVYQALAHKRADKIMEPFLLMVPPGNARNKALAHEGEEFMMVLRGSIDLLYGEQKHRLRSGDCAYFEGAVRHTLRNPGNRPSAVLVLYADRNWQGAATDLGEYWETAGLAARSAGGRAPALGKDPAGPIPKGCDTNRK